MTLSNHQSKRIKEHLIGKIRDKLDKYNPETNQMPFHYRLLGKDRMALFSFVHSVNTMLGASIFEKAGELIAESNSNVNISVAQYKKLEGFISEKATTTIDKILRDLRANVELSNKPQEINKVLAATSKGKQGRKIKKRVDLFVGMKDGTEYYFELKTAKPNIDGFTSVKKQLLDWVAIRGSQESEVKLKTILAIPYNPYEPKPYDRWTLQGLFDLKEEVLVGKEFWDFLGGKNTYEDLLKVFEQAGLELYDDIDQKMKEIGKK